MVTFNLINKENGIFTYEDVRNVKRIFAEEDVLEYQYTKPEYNEMVYDNITVQDGIAL